ncbi:hypothetical protein MPSEU_000599400 [Mayamaea pseudoterrestris]|nr:hypothetical protein MPSEU_000599400 [Mayamaea pseudoterrestris]
MKIAATVLAIAGSAAAFAPSSNSKASLTTSRVALDELPGSSLPVPKFDPLGLASVGSDETFRWFQAAEQKNGRAAMVAVTGYIVQAAGIHFPGMLSKDVSFESLSGLNPIDQWALVPDAGKAQILATCFIAELVTESKGTHYMKGGDLPGMVFPAIDFSGVDAATLKKKRTSELNNGRLAMIAIIGFISEYNIPGAVPAISGIPIFHSS